MFSPNRNRPERPSDRRPDTQRKPMTREVKRRMGATVALTFILLIIWFGCIAWGDARYDTTPLYAVMIAYSVAFAAILITYLAYNRAFVNKDVTVDMLPDDWSEEKKQRFVDDNRRRAERSRWMVTLIIPFAIVFMVEAVYLFVWDGVLSEFFKGLGG